MLMTLTEHTKMRFRDIAYFAVTSLILLLAFLVAFEAITVRTLNTAIINGLSALLALL